MLTVLAINYNPVQTIIMLTVLAIDHCSGAPCLHGKCKLIHNDYECCCDAGWTGANCDICK